MNLLQALLCTGLSAVMLSLGIPNELFKTGSALFGLVALIPLYTALARVRSTRTGGLLGGLMMLLVHLMSSFWLMNFKEFAIFTLGGSALVSGTFGILAGQVFHHSLKYPRAVRPFLFAVAWTVWEWYKSSGFLGYPWGTLPMTAESLSYLIQIAEITGMWGVSFLLALVSAIIAEICIRLAEGANPPIIFARLPDMKRLRRESEMHIVEMVQAEQAMLPIQTAIPGTRITQKAGLPYAYADFIMLVPKAIHSHSETTLLQEYIEDDATSENDVANGGDYQALQENFFTRESACIRAAIFTVFLLGATVAWGAWRITTLPEPEAQLEAVMIQQNADSWGEDGGPQRALLSVQDLTRKAIAERSIPPDLVIWNESVLVWPYMENRDYFEVFPRQDPLASFLSEIHTPVLTGGPVLVDPASDGYSNSALLIAPDGELLDWSAKIQLVAFAEFMPLTEYEWVRNTFDAIVGFSRGWVPGEFYKSFGITTRDGFPVRFAVPICFEDAFPALVAKHYQTGCNIIVNITNDSWSKTDSAEYQHHSVAFYRAIELRTTLVRSTNGGYTTVISPTGKILASLPLFESTWLNASIPIYPRIETLYARFRDWFPALMTAILALTFILFRHPGRGRCLGRYHRPKNRNQY